MDDWTEIICAFLKPVFNIARFLYDCLKDVLRKCGLNMVFGMY